MQPNRLKTCCAVSVSGYGRISPRRSQCASHISGTTNWKYAPARKVELRLIDTTRKYAVAEIERLIVSKSSTREAAVRTQPRPTNSQISAYAQKAFDEEIARVRSATEGERNDTLNRASFLLGNLSPAANCPMRWCAAHYWMPHSARLGGARGALNRRVRTCGRRGRATYSARARGGKSFSGLGQSGSFDRQWKPPPSA